MTKMMDKKKRASSFRQIQSFLQDTVEQTSYDVLVIDMNCNDYDFYEGISISFMSDEMFQMESKYVITIHFNNDLEDHCIPITDLPDRILSCFDYCRMTGKWLTFTDSWHRSLRIYIRKHDGSENGYKEMLQFIS